MDIGSFVRAERKRQGLTQQQLADRSGVGLNFVYQLEKNKPSVQLDSVNQVLRALGYQVGVMRDFRPWEAAAEWEQNQEQARLGGRHHAIENESCRD